MIAESVLDEPLSTAPVLLGGPAALAEPADEDEAWARYGDLAFEAVVDVPLKEMCLGDLARVQPGTVFRSAAFATEGAALSAGGVFLANVSLEAAEDKLGFRINNFAQMRPRPAVAASVSGLRNLPGDETHRGTVPDSLMHMRVSLSLCFGTRRMQIREAAQLTSGDLIPLDQGLREPVSVTANGCVVANGKLVLIGACYAVEVLSTTPDLPAPGAEQALAGPVARAVRLVADPEA